MFNKQPVVPPPYPLFRTPTLPLSLWLRSKTKHSSKASYELRKNCQEEKITLFTHVSPYSSSSILPSHTLKCEYERHLWQSLVNHTFAVNVFSSQEFLEQQQAIALGDQTSTRALGMNSCSLWYAGEARLDQPAICQPQA